ncbi:Hypothetical protein associated region in TFIID subunit [Nesidiocoris tenuis]|uniref:TFIID subunit TAF5 NTD2 domain-containing protein n=1 Tax=Nesidiocoris tenuis TaxID=355587 RepID=A0ABN7ALQ5_9HEMI|nr:Hypothetical protein associated region in TFIID subunit [Nesidiocoris tenuis]
MQEYEADEPTAVLIDYLRRRNYLSTRPQGFKEDEAEMVRVIEMATVLPNAASAETAIFDLKEATHQFSTFTTWVRDMKPGPLSEELTGSLMPILCHMYLNCLPVNNRQESSTNFLRWFVDYPGFFEEEWMPFFKQLLLIDDLEEVNSLPLVKSFREVRLELRLSIDGIVTLRKCLVENNLYLIVQVLRQWFRLSMMTEEMDVPTLEELSKPGNPKSNQSHSFCNVNIKKEEDEDPVLADLLNVINEKRTQTTRPPPLLLYTAHRTEGIVCGKVSGDGKLAVTGDSRSELRVWGIVETKLTPQLHADYFSSIPINTYTETFDASQTLKDKQMWWLRGHSSTVFDTAFINDSEWLLSVSFDCTMRLWKLSDFSCSVVYRGHSMPIWSVAVSPIPNMIATASCDKTARLWNLDRTFPIRIMAGHQEDVSCVAFHPNGCYVASGSPDKTVRLWSVTDGNMMRVLAGSDQGPVDAVAFSPNGQFVASAGDDSNVWLWDIRGGTPMCKLSGHKSRIVSIEWNHDGSALSAASLDGDIFLWNVDTPEACGGEIVPKKYSTKCSRLLSLQYSAKNALVAVGLE